MRARTLLAAVLLACLPLVASAQSTPPGAYSGGSRSVILGTSAATACTAIDSTDGFLRRLTYAGNASMAATITFYDESATTGTCAAADAIFSASVTFGEPTQADVRYHLGLLYTLTSALTAPLSVGLN